MYLRFAFAGILVAYSTVGRATAVNDTSQNHTEPVCLYFTAIVWTGQFNCEGSNDDSYLPNCDIWLKIDILQPTTQTILAEHDSALNRQTTRQFNAFYWADPNKDVVFKFTVIDDDTPTWGATFEEALADGGDVLLEKEQRFDHYYYKERSYDDTFHRVIKFNHDRLSLSYEIQEILCFAAPDH